MKKRVVLVKPNSKDSHYGKLKYLSAIEPPIWHCILASYYDAVGVVDAEVDDLTDADTVQAVMKYDPDKIVILATGSHPSAFVQQKDKIIKLDIMFEKYKREVLPLFSFPINPNQHLPKWNVLNFEDYRTHNWHSWTNNRITQPYGVTYTSVSCPFKCSFCTVHQFYGDKYRERPIDDIISDLDVFAKAKVKNVKFMDELFIFREQRVHEICDEIIKRGYDFNIWAYARIDIMNGALLEKLRKAGVRWLAYGIESGNDEIRKDALKGHFTKERIKDVINMTRDYDICVIGNYMFGFWEDTLATMQETFDLASELNTEYVNFYCVVAYPNTPLYKKLQEEGVSLPTDFNQYAQTGENFKPNPTKYLSSKEVLKFRDHAFRNYFTNSTYLSSIRAKFGLQTLDEVNKMVNISIKRNI